MAPHPDSLTETITFHLTVAMLRRVKAEALWRGISVGALVRERLEGVAEDKVDNNS